MFFNIISSCRQHYKPVKGWMVGGTWIYDLRLKIDQTADYPGSHERVDFMDFMDWMIFMARVDWTDWMDCEWHFKDSSSIIS